MKRTKSIYSVTFDENSACWTKSRKDNLLFLRLTQNHVNDLLCRRCHVIPNTNITARRGWLWLNEVLEMLDMPPTKEGFVVGWTYDENNPIGDNFVDFSINPRGTNPNVVLDFNVDGIIGDNIFP